MPSPPTTPEPPDNLPPRPRLPHPSLRISTGRSTAPDPLPGGRAPDPTPITSTSTSSSQSRFSRDIPETQVDELLRPFENQDIQSGPPSAGPSGLQHEVHGDTGSRRPSLPLGESANQERYITRISEEGEGNTNHYSEGESHVAMDVDQTPQPTYTSISPDREGRSSPDVPRTPISRELSPPTQTDQEQMSSPTFHFERERGHEHRSAPSELSSPQSQEEEDHHQPNHDESQDEPKDHMRLRGGGPAISAFDRWYSYPEPYNWRGAELHEENMNRVPPDMLPNDPPIVFPNFAQKRAEHLAAQEALAEEEAKAKQDNGTAPAEQLAPERKDPAEKTDDPDVKPYSLDPPTSIGSEAGEEELRLRGRSHLDYHESGSSNSPNSIEGSPLRFRALSEPLPTQDPEETSTTFRGSKATVPTLLYHYPNDTLLHLQRPILPTSSGDAPRDVQNSSNPFKWHIKPLSAIRRVCQRAVHLLIPSRFRSNSDTTLPKQFKSHERHRRFGSETDRSDDSHPIPTSFIPPQVEVTSPTDSPSSQQGTIISTPPGYTVESYSETATSHHIVTGQQAPRKPSANPFFSAMTDPGPSDDHPKKNDKEGSEDSSEHTPSPGPSNPASPAPPAPPAPLAPPAPQPQSHTTEPPVPQSADLVRSSSDHVWRDKLKNVFALPRNRSETNTAATGATRDGAKVAITDENLTENMKKKKLSSDHRGNNKNTKSVQPVPTITTPPTAQAGSSTGPDTQAGRQEDGDEECCPWQRRARWFPFVPMERSSGQGPTAEIGERDHRLIAVADHLFPCLRPRAEHAKRTVEEAVTGEGEGQHGNGSKGTGKGKGKDEGEGRGKDKGKGKQTRFDDDDKGPGAGGPSGGNGGSGSGGAGPSGGGSGTDGGDNAGEDGDHEGSPGDNSGNQPGEAGGNGEPRDAPPAPGVIPQTQQDSTSTSPKTHDPSNTQSNEIEPSIGPAPEPKPFTMPIATGGTELATTKSLPPPARSRPTSSSGRPDSITIPPDTITRPGTEDEPVLAHPGLPSSEMVKSGSGTSGKTFGQNAHTPGTGYQEDVPPVPDLGRSDEGMFRSTSDESGNDHSLTTPSPSYLSQQPTHTVFGATTADIRSSTPPPPSPLGIGHPSSPERPKSLLTASQNDPQGSNIPYTQAQLEQISRDEAQRRWMAQHERNITPSGTSPQGGSPLSSGGTSPIALFTSSQLAHPLEVPAQSPSTDSRSVFDPQTPPGGYPSGSGLSDIAEGSREGLPSLESSGTVSTESSHVGEPMGSLGQAVQAAEAVPTFTAEYPQEDKGRVRPSEEIDLRPPTPVTKDSQFDERASFADKQGIDPVTYVPQGYTMEQPRPEPSQDLPSVTSGLGPVPFQQSSDISPKDKSHITEIGAQATGSHQPAVPTPDQGGSGYRTESEEEVVYHRRANGIAGDDLAGRTSEEPEEVSTQSPVAASVAPEIPKKRWYKRLWRRMKRVFH